MDVTRRGRRGAALMTVSAVGALALVGCASGGGSGGGDGLTAAQKVADQCTADGVEFTADGEVLVMRFAMAAMEDDAPSPFDAGSDVGACFEEQGFLEGSDLESDFDTAVADDDASLAMFSEDGLVLIAGDVFMRMTMWDGGDQMTDMGAFLEEAFSQMDSEEFVMPDAWFIQFEIGPDDGTHEATELSATSDPLASDDADGGDTTTALVRFGETFTYDDGLEVTIGTLAAYEPSEYAWAEGDRFVVFTVTIVNGTGEVFDPSGFSTTASSGGREADEVYDSENGLEGSPMTSIQPGKSVSFEVAYGVSDASDLTLDVSPDWWDHDTFTVTTG